MKGVFFAASAVCVLALNGCDSVLAGLDKPRASVKGARLSGLTLTGATLDFDVAVDNPYGVPLPLTDLRYGLSSGNSAQPFAQGKANVAGTIPAKGSRTLQVPVTLDFASVMGLVQGLRPGKLLPYQADLELSVDAPGVGLIGLPLRQSGQLPIPAVPKFDVSQLKWSELSLSRVAGTMDLGITNTNEFPLNLSALSYVLSLGGNRVFESVAKNGLDLAPGAAGRLQIPISFSPAQAGLGLLSMLGGSGGGYNLEGILDAKTPFGALALPFAQAGQAAFSK